jgi:hypothetical protein
MSVKHRSGDENSSCADSASEPVRRTERIRRLVKHTLAESSDDSSDREGSPGQLTRFQSTLGIKLRAVDPGYITHAGDYQRVDLIIPVSDVYELLHLKMELSEEVAKVWQSTAEMGFSLTDEEHMVVCPKDLREGTITDRYLAPAITRFAIKVGNQDGHDPTLNPEEREILALHQKWSKDYGELQDDDIKEPAEMNDGVPQKFTMMVQRKNHLCEKDSRSRAEFDPESFPDCNVKANVGRDFLFHETIPKPETERGSLRVTKTSLRWQQREFPGVWTTEGLSFCMEKGYINSSTWNHLQTLW